MKVLVLILVAMGAGTTLGRRGVPSVASMLLEAANGNWKNGHRPCFSGASTVPESSQAH